MTILTKCCDCLHIQVFTRDCYDAVQINRIHGIRMTPNAGFQQFFQEGITSHHVKKTAFFIEI